MVEKQARKRGVDALLGERGLATVMDSLESEGRATITGIEAKNLKEVETYFQGQGYKVNAIAEKMDDEKNTFILVVKKPAVPIISKFEAKNEFTKKH